MGGKVKCKKCGRKFNWSIGREGITKFIEECNKTACPLKSKQFQHVPSKPIETVESKSEPANDQVSEDVVEHYEELPIGGLVSYKEIRKKYGWKL